MPEHPPHPQQGWLLSLPRNAVIRVIEPGRPTWLAFADNFRNVYLLSVRDKDLRFAPTTEAEAAEHSAIAREGVAHYHAQRVPFD